MNRKSADNWLKRLIDFLEAEIELIPEVVANPTLAGTEDDLESLQIGDTKYKVPSGSGTEVVANPTLAGTESDLEGLQVGDTKYKVPSGGTEVIANPTLAGTESDLTGLQVGNTKYKVPSGGGLQLYQHNIRISVSNETNLLLTIINNSNTPLSGDDVLNFLNNKGFTLADHLYQATGFGKQSLNYISVFGAFMSGNAIYGRGFDPTLSSPVMSNMQMYVFGSSSYNIEDNIIQI